MTINSCLFLIFPLFDLHFPTFSLCPKSIHQNSFLISVSLCQSPCVLHGLPRVESTRESHISPPIGFLCDYSQRRSDPDRQMRVLAHCPGPNSTSLLSTDFSYVQAFRRYFSIYVLGRLATPLKLGFTVLARPPTRPNSMMLLS